MSKNVKELRGQLRQIAKELLTEELVKELDSKLTKLIIEKLNHIEKKQKDLIGLTLRSQPTQFVVKK